MADMLEALKKNPWPDVAWGPEDKPVVLVDGKVHRLSQVSAPIDGRVAYAVGVNEKLFPNLCAQIRVEFLHCYELRVADVSALAEMQILRGLAIRWNTKLADLSPLCRLVNLEQLALEDTPKAHDLAPLANLVKLKSLEFSGGIWNKNQADSLEPIARLPKLEDLTLLNLKVVADGLRPLALCPVLKHLEVSNQFKTEDYAYLSVRLPETKCDWFAPCQQLTKPIGDKDVMVTGARKPMLNSVADAERLQRYENTFRKLQERFRSASG